MITRKSQYKNNAIKYSDYIKLIGYLSKNCNDKDYHAAMIKLAAMQLSFKET